MLRVLNSFKVRSGLKLVDYRLGEDLDSQEIKVYFQSRDYKIGNLQNSGRHVTGILTKAGEKYFLKLSTSEGISIVTQNEFNWNNYFNANNLNNKFHVPKNFDSGYFKDKYFYLITNYFNGKLLCQFRDQYQNLNLLTKSLTQIIELAENIQQLPDYTFAIAQYQDGDSKLRFINKANAWFDDIPINIRDKYNLQLLIKVAIKGIDKLFSKPRHGDFAPWHIMTLGNNKLGLIDGEHALSDGVENYDICYFIQRVFSVLKKPDIAENIYLELRKRKYEVEKLKTILAARAIGGFLDESLNSNPDYMFANAFKDWVLALND
ncbi:hypothetical protein HYU93_02420 [Candidatus Daviesbacteria bacterium]|nr:hypothetical protein [Candidatus Daviesbacteria bacterium]